MRILRPLSLRTDEFNYTLQILLAAMVGLLAALSNLGFRALIEFFTWVFLVFFAGSADRMTVFFGLSYPALLADDDACLLLAVDGEERLGYLLGFRHLTFYANGPVAWVEEVFVRGQHRGRGIGRALMSGFERWAATRDCALVALATRRAAPFYRALGYEESAVYFRKVLGNNRIRPDARDKRKLQSC